VFWERGSDPASVKKFAGGIDSELEGGLLIFGWMQKWFGGSFEPLTCLTQRFLDFRQRGCFLESKFLCSFLHDVVPSWVLEPLSNLFDGVGGIEAFALWKLHDVEGSFGREVL